jgi:hypothetical protein
MEMMYNSSLKPLRQSENEKVLCTTVPQGLIRLVKILANEKKVRLNHIIIEAIQDLLIKHESFHRNKNEN